MDSKYDYMSDEQLCESVLKIKRPELFNDDFVHKFVDGKTLAVFHRVCGYVEHFSLDWACIGKLVVEQHMSLEMPHPELGGCGTVSIYNPLGTDWYVDFDISANPLRAAAIVYLMMKECENGRD